MPSERKTSLKNRMLVLVAIIATVVLVGVGLEFFRQVRVAQQTMPEGADILIGSGGGRDPYYMPILPSGPPNLHVLVRDELEKLSPGRVLFNPPTEMRQGDKERVEVRITKDMDADLKAGLTGRGVPEVEIINVNTFMSVRMFGDGFEVTPKSDEEQFVGEADYTEWLFDVLPVESGRKILELLVTVRIKLPDGQEVRNLPVKHRKINVEVDPWWVIKRFVSAHWKWFLGGIAGAVAVVI